LNRRRIDKTYPQEAIMGDVTGGEILARCLASEGVKFVFGLPSLEIDPLLAQLAGHANNTGSASSTLRRRRPSKGRTSSTSSALEQAKAATGSAVVCLRTDRDANLAIPQEMILRFVEVYQGPM
jgi:hypothetical protein